MTRYLRHTGLEWLLTSVSSMRVVQLDHVLPRHWWISQWTVLSRKISWTCNWCGPLMTAKILQHNGEVVCRSFYQPLNNRQSYKETTEKKLGAKLTLNQMKRLYFLVLQITCLTLMRIRMRFHSQPLMKRSCPKYRWWILAFTFCPSQ